MPLRSSAFPGKFQRISPRSRDAAVAVALRVAATLLTLAMLTGCFGPKYGEAEEQEEATTKNDATKPAAKKEDVLVPTSETSETSETTKTTDTTEPAAPACTHASCFDFEREASLAPFAKDPFGDGTCVRVDSRSSAGKASLSCEDAGLIRKRAPKSGTLAFDAFIGGAKATAATNTSFDFGSIFLSDGGDASVALGFRATFSPGMLGVIELVVDIDTGTTFKSQPFPTNIQTGAWHHFEIHYEGSGLSFKVSASADRIVLFDNGTITTDKPLIEEETAIYGGLAPFNAFFDNVTID